MRHAHAFLLTLALVVSAAGAHATGSSAGPRALSTPAPVYDEAERRAGHAGEVQVVMRVDTDGKVVEARVARSSGWPVLDASALDAARQWTFEPARDADGKAVAAQVQLPIAFTAAPAPVADDPLAQARASSCAAFLSDVSAYRLAHDPLGGGRFATVWGGLMEQYKVKYGPAAALAKMPVAKRVFENTVASCRRAPARSLGAAVEAEFYQVR
jgi:TonB family protein